jgi:hypothetical protein
MMKWIVITAIAATFSANAALSQTMKPDVSSAPSAQNSGAGIAGAPGNKNGPAVKPGDTVGSPMNQQNPTVQQQDTSNIKGMPGNKNGPPAKKPEQR